MSCDAKPRRAKGDSRPRAGRFATALLLGAVLFGILGNVDPAFAKNGENRILGKVVSSETGEPLPFTNLVLVRISAEGDTVPAGGTFSMNDGTFRLDAEPGTYRLQASYIGYHLLNINDLVVTAEGEPLALDIPLTPSAVVVETVEVTAKAITSTAAFILQSQKKSPAVSDGISSEQMKKSTDSNAAEALQRVTGVSVVGGQFVVVRGLGERYSTTTINGAQVGTPETNRRVLPMDLFPASLLDNMVIQKTYTPDQPGDFGGGVVNVSTRQFPGDKVWNVSVGTGYNSSTTGKNYRSYRGGSLDFLGFDDGARKLPDEVPTRLITPDSEFCEGEDCLTQDEVAGIGRSFSFDWKTETDDGGLPRSFSASYGNEVELLYRPLGFMLSTSYRNGFQTESRIERGFNGGDELSPKTDYRVLDSESSVLWGAIATAGYRLHDLHTVNLDLMYNRSAEDDYRFYSGTNYDFGSDIRETRFSYVERGVFSSGLGMRHHLPILFGSVMEWKYSYANASRNEPDRRSFIYELIPGNPDDGTEDAWALSTRSLSSGFVRTYGILDEDTRGLQASLSVPFRQWGSLDSKLKIGSNFSNKDRQFDYRRFSYRAPSSNQVDRSLPPEELLTEDMVGTDPRSTFRFQETTRPVDSYRAAHDISAVFAMVDLPVTQKLRLVGGVRYEKSDQTVTTYDRFARGDAPLKATLSDQDYLPAINATYALTEEINLRAAVSQTVNRPDLRELSPYGYNDQGASAYEQSGNPDLVQSKIDNYDIRIECYPTLEEMVAISGFWKALDHPIEQSIRGGQQPVIQPVNADRGELYGVELEGRASLARLGNALDNFGLHTNVTFVESEAEVLDLGNLAASKRPLTGQSPYVVNLGLFFASDQGTNTASLLYSVFGKRLYSLGLAELPDIYERPRHSVDLTLGREFGSFQLKLGIENLLDSEEEFQQADQAVKLSDRGRSVNFSISTGS